MATPVAIRSGPTAHCSRRHGPAQAHPVRRWLLLLVPVVAVIGVAFGLVGRASDAAPLRDGARIYVPRPGEAVPAGALGSTAETKVNVNSATANELDALPGVGPATAAAIVRARTTKPFATVDELQTRGLVSPKVFADLRDLVTVR